jgi:uncharacterized protein YjbI with pentapeptide repeats
VQTVLARYLRQGSSSRRLYEASLIYARERGVALEGALKEADPQGSSLCGHVFSAEDLMEETSLRDGAERLGPYPSEIAEPVGSVSLAGADLSGAHLRGADSGGADRSCAC